MSPLAVVDQVAWDELQDILAEALEKAAKWDARVAYAKAMASGEVNRLRSAEYRRTHLDELRAKGRARVAARTPEQIEKQRAYHRARYLSRREEMLAAEKAARSGPDGDRIRAMDRARVAARSEFQKDRDRAYRRRWDQDHQSEKQAYNKAYRQLHEAELRAYDADRGWTQDQRDAARERRTKAIRSGIMGTYLNTAVDRSPA